MEILDKLGVDVGTKVTHMKTVTETDIGMFAGVSGDFNPVHMCEQYAKKTIFGGRIAHGIIPVGLISAAMTKLPGLVILLSESNKFLAPVKIGDSITATSEVIKAKKDKGIITLKTTCINQEGEAVVEGEWVLRLAEKPD